MRISLPSLPLPEFLPVPFCSNTTSCPLTTLSTIATCPYVHLLATTISHCLALLVVNVILAQPSKKRLFGTSLAFPKLPIFP